MTTHSFSTPVDLANAIGTWLKSRRIETAGSFGGHRRSSDIPDAALVSLCEIMYMASVATQEGEFVRVELVYLDPDHVEQKDNASWQVFAFAQRFPFSLPNLIRLSPASDPRNSAIALFHDSDGDIFIWGLIDQRDPAYRILRREVSSRTHDTCGIFEASIEGPANIFVHSGAELIGELNIGSLRKAGNYMDVFRSGPIAAICESGIRSIATRLSGQIKDKITEDVLSSARHAFISTLCTVLYRLQTFRHGGALLIRKTSDDHLLIRYPMKYDRLTKTLEQNALQRVFQLAHPDDRATMNGGIFGKYEEVLDSAIWFVAVLTRVDGAVVLNSELGIEGFGAIIRCQHMPPDEQVYISRQPEVTDDALEPLDSDRLGTRHQSMIRYCFEHPGTAGFVVSEDGDARAMSFVEGKIIVWENIKLLNVV